MGSTKRMAKLNDPERDSKIQNGLISLFAIALLTPYQVWTVGAISFQRSQLVSYELISSITIMCSVTSTDTW